MVERAGQDRVAVVGAGPAGLSAAWYLRGAGYGDVTVLEAVDPGRGQVLHVREQGSPDRVGAFTVSPAYEQTMSIARDVGAPLTVQPRRLAWEGGDRIRPVRKVVLRDAGLLGLLWAALRYLLQLRSYRSVLGPPGFGGLAASPHREAGLASRSVLPWLERHRLTALTDMFDMVVPDMGYGRLGTVPTVYVLKYIGVLNFLTLSMVGLGLTRRWPKRFAHGFGHLWERVGRTLEVRTGVQIEAIVRSADGVEIRTSERTYAFDRLVVACPIDQLIEVLHDPSADERWLGRPRRLSELPGVDRPHPGRAVSDHRRGPRAARPPAVADPRAWLGLIARPSTWPAPPTARRPSANTSCARRCGRRTPVHSCTSSSSSSTGTTSRTSRKRP